jgi:hypothetical protein
MIKVFAVNKGSSLLAKDWMSVFKSPLMAVDVAVVSATC